MYENLVRDVEIINGKPKTFYSNWYIVARADGWDKPPDDIRKPSLFEVATHESSLLYQDFFGLSNKTDILKFANIYGLLTEPESWQAVQDLAHTERFPVTGEPLYLWTDAIAEMRLVLDVWNYADEANDEALAKHVRSYKIPPSLLAVDESPVQTLSLHLENGGAVIDSDYPSFRNPSRTDLARYLIGCLFDERLRGSIKSSVSYEPNHGWGMRVEPTTLLSALWYGLYNDLRNSSGVIVCDYCHKTYVLKRGQHRDRKFCDRQTCRVKASPSYKAQRKRSI